MYSLTHSVRVCYWPTFCIPCTCLLSICPPTGIHWWCPNYCPRPLTMAHRNTTNGPHVPGSEWSTTSAVTVSPFPHSIPQYMPLTAQVLIRAGTVPTTTATAMAGGQDSALHRLTEWVTRPNYTRGHPTTRVYACPWSSHYVLLSLPVPLCACTRSPIRKSLDSTRLNK